MVRASPGPSVRTDSLAGTASNFIKQPHVLGGAAVPRPEIMRTARSGISRLQIGLISQRCPHGALPSGEVWVWTLGRVCTDHVLSLWAGAADFLRRQHSKSTRERLLHYERKAL